MRGGDGLQWTRRAVLAAGACQALAACASRGGAEDAQSVRRPPVEGRVRSWNDGLDGVVSKKAKIETIAQGLSSARGPVWVGGYNAGYLLFSDVRENVLLRWTPGAGVQEFLRPAGLTGGDAGGLTEPGANGLGLGRPGELLMCDTGNRAVASVDLFSRRKAVLCSKYKGKRLNGPTDLVLSRSGAIYFTDPPTGLEGLDASPLKELAFNGVFRLAPNGALAVIEETLTRPEGIALSPDEKVLYVANADPEHPAILAYALDDKGAATGSATFFDAAQEAAKGVRTGPPHGIAVDGAGRVFAAGPGAVTIFAADGRPLGQITCNRVVSGCAFGEDGALFFTAEDVVARVPLAVA